MKLLKYLGFLLFNPIWYLQLIIPRNKKVWIFGAWYGEKYSDNVKVLFEYVNENLPEIKTIWLTRNRTVIEQLELENKNVANINGIRGIYYSLIAGKVIFSSGKNDVNKFFINGAILINTWHGAPMKKIGLDDKFASTSNSWKGIIRYLFPFIWEYNVDFLVSIAEVFNSNLCTAFNLRNDQIILSGYPRCDLLFNTDLHYLTLKWDNMFNKPRKIMYLPTFRSEVDAFLPFENFGFEEDVWGDYLKESNSILISKGHFIDKKIGDSSKVERIIHISDDAVPELNDLLKDIDVLITDYSGVYFDFLLTDKPIILAPFDLEVYLSESRELYFEYYDVVCGPVTINWDQILKYLQMPTNEIFNEHNYNQKKIYFNKYCSGGNAKRLTEHIFKL